MTTTDMTMEIGANESTPAFTPEELTVTGNPIRAQFISLMCTAAYDDLDEGGASDFIEKCLKLCGGSKELLLQVLQTRFMDNRTPLYWVLCHTRRLSDGSTSIPPLVDKVLSYSGLSNSNIVSEMELACALKEHRLLHQLIRRHHLQCGDIINPGSWKDGYWTNSIRIPQFLDRMLISGKISAPIINWWTVFDFTFTINSNDNWAMRLEREIFHPQKALTRELPNRFELNVHKVRLYENENHEKWMKDTKKISGNVKELRSKDGVNLDFLRGWDDFFDKRRTLAITLALGEWRKD